MQAGNAVTELEQVEGFARHMNNLRLPSGLNRNSNYHLFKKGIRPVRHLPIDALTVLIVALDVGRSSKRRGALS